MTTSARRDVVGSRLALASGAATLLAGAALFLSASTLLPSFQPNQDSIRIMPATFSWLGRVKVQVAEPTPAAQAVAKLTSNVSLPEIRLPAAPVRPARKTFALKKVLKRRLARVAVVAEPIAAAAIEKAEETSAPAPLQAATVDIQRMQGIHALLRGRFLAAIEPELLQPVATQLAEVQVNVPAPKVVAARRARPARVVEKQAVVEAPAVSEPTPPPSAPKATEVSDELRFAKAAPSDPITTLISSEPSAPVAVLDNQETDLPAKAADSRPAADQQPARNDEAPTEVQTTKLVDTQPEVIEQTRSSPPDTQIESGAKSATSPQLLAMLPAVNTHVAYPTARDYSAPAVRPVVIQPPQPKTVPRRSHASTESKKDGPTPAVHLAARSVTVRQTAAPTVVEAFDWRNEVSSPYTEVLTRETADADAQGWRRTRAELHWPTLHWSPALGATTVPVVAENTARLLAAKLNAPLLPDAGMVFGRIPAGWSVEFSGRAERPLVLNSQNIPITGAQTDEDAYFVFLNASPGAQMVHLTGPSGEYSGAVAIPVLSGAATFLDLSRIQYRSFMGQVLDGSAAETSGIRNAQVRVAGQPGAAAVTDTRGRFSLNRVLVAGDLPIFVETDAERGFTHRYRISPSHTGELMLYRVTDRQVQEWVGQLEGGISAESGLVISALPSLIAAQADGSLAPRVRSLATSPTLVPEVYALGTLGELHVGMPLSDVRTRFISLQLAEGPAVVSAENSGGKQVWAELIMASPGVVNMVGPY